MAERDVEDCALGEIPFVDAYAEAFHERAFAALHQEVHFAYSNGRIKMCRFIQNQVESRAASPISGDLDSSLLARVLPGHSKKVVVGVRADIYAVVSIGNSITFRLGHEYLRSSPVRWSQLP